MTRLRSSNVTVMLITCNLTITIALAISLLPDKPATAYAPLAYCGVAAVYKRVRPILPIALVSYVFVLLVTISRNWQDSGLESFQFFLSGTGEFTYGRPIHLLTFVYLPLLTMAVGLNHFDLPGELVAIGAWRLRFCRVFVSGLMIMLLLRDTILERYQSTLSTLAARGVRIPKYLPGLRLAKLWLPVIVTTILVDAFERYHLFKQFNLSLSSLHPRPRPVSLATYQIGLMVSAAIGASLLIIRWIR